MLWGGAKSKKVMNKISCAFSCFFCAVLVRSKKTITGWFHRLSFMFADCACLIVRSRLVRFVIHLLAYSSRCLVLLFVSFFRLFVSFALFLLLLSSSCFLLCFLFFLFFFLFSRLVSFRLVIFVFILLAYPSCFIVSCVVPFCSFCFTRRFRLLVNHAGGSNHMIFNRF